MIEEEVMFSAFGFSVGIVAGATIMLLALDTDNAACEKQYDVYNWSHYNKQWNNENLLSEFWDYGKFTQPSFGFKWACWAIASTIKLYNENKNEVIL